MLKEWIDSIIKYFIKAWNAISIDINGEKFSRRNRVIYHVLFLLLTIILVTSIPKGFSPIFCDYIKDIFAIFVGFFVTVLTFVFDKLDVTKIPTEEEMDLLPVEKRWDSRKLLLLKREHNYTIRFFYSIGLVIINATIVLCLLIPYALWDNFLGQDLQQYVFIKSWDALSFESLLLFAYNSICIIYRMIIIYLIITVFYFTLYTTSSLLQVLKSKKKL